MELGDAIGAVTSQAAVDRFSPGEQSKARQSSDTKITIF
jgi:hypothetical protein